MTDEPKNYYALDMANGRTYIGRLEKDPSRVPNTYLEDVISTNTITNYNIYEEFPEVSDVKGLYKEFYKLCIKKLGKEALGCLTNWRDNNYLIQPAVIMEWYLGQNILDE